MHGTVFGTTFSHYCFKNAQLEYSYSLLHICDVLVFIKVLSGKYNSLELSYRIYGIIFGIML